MKKRLIYWVILLLFAGCLYFFENNTGTRIMLICVILQPLVPALRRALFVPDEAKKQPGFHTQTVKTFTSHVEDEPGNIRDYQPGDPVNRIHWKLSAKRDSLLVRAQASDNIPEDIHKKTQVEATSAYDRNKRACIYGLFAVITALLLLFLVPSANQGVQALANRLFEASEAVNAYAYIRFPVPAEQPVALAVLLLFVILIALVWIIGISGSRLLALVFMGCCAAFQVYFGLAFPAWVNVPLFILFVLWIIRRPPERRTVILILACAAAVSLGVALFYPGVDAATETASERVRDKLSQMSQFITGTVSEMPLGENETRHTHTMSITTGGQEARTEKEYQLVTVEEQQFSMPRWVNYLKIILLLILAVTLVILPFLPFLLLNARRKKALELQKRFHSENISEAISAIFQHVIAWLEATGHSAENKPYSEWLPTVTEHFTPEYADHFARCEKLFEEAAYSTHEMHEEQRQQALSLLQKTEEILLAKTDWKQRFLLRYRECLWT